jgi:DNA-binding CsgD family transcriptional regulator
MSDIDSRNARDNRAAPEHLLALLTPREYEVAELLAEGLSNEQISDRLVLVPGTVANHVAHILDKLGADSRVQVAVKVAVEKSSMHSAAVLGLLERLRELKRATLDQALQHATDVLAEAFAADKVDAFLWNRELDLLIAVGTSRTPMGARQRELGLHRLPLAAGGRAAWVFRQGRPYLDGRVQEDEMELLGVRQDLGVRSTMAVPLEIDDQTRGVLQAASGRSDQFSSAQLQLLQFVSYWVALVAGEQDTRGEGGDGGAAHP